MNELRALRGFEEALRPPVDVRRARVTPPVLRPPGRAGDTAAYAQLARVIRRAPEVMVKVTGRTRDAGHLGRHLDYISRNGEVSLEGPEGERYDTREAIREVAEAWSEDLAQDRSRRKDSPMSLSIVLSMPKGTDPSILQDAARAFATTCIGERFPYVMALHDEGRHPHVHLTVCALGSEGRKLNPRKADLEVWRQVFAQQLRARGLEAEATPRRARGRVRKPESIALRKAMDRYRAGGPIPERLRAAYRDAALNGDEAAAASAAKRRQAEIREALEVEARKLLGSSRPLDQVLGRALEKHVKGMPPPETRRDVLRRLSGNRTVDRER